MISLRSDQQILHDSIRASMAAGHRSPLVVAPCGFGKTVMFCDFTDKVSKKGNRSMILSHREELVQQISETLDRFDHKHSFIAADRVYDPACTTQVASVMTLARRIDQIRYVPDLILVDEAHHSVAGSWQKILSRYGRIRRVGFTATAQRLDGAPLGDTYDDLIVGPTMGDCIQRGVLSNYMVVAPPVDMSTVPKRGGDFDKAELAKRYKGSVLTGDAVKNYSKYASGKRAVVFCVSLDYCQDVAAQFRAAGYNAAVLDGTMGRYERREQVKMFRDGHLDLLVTCDLISEGFDLPAIEAAVMLRPTESLTLWIQQFGRALRMYPGKGTAVILDHAGNTERHGWLPETEVEWSLDGKAKMKQGDGLPAVRRCSVVTCFKAAMTTAPNCPYCGAPYPLRGAGPREVKQLEGDLVPMSEEQLERIRRERKIQQGRCETLEDLIAYGFRREMKNPVGWARHVWKARLDKMHSEALEMNAERNRTEEALL